MIETDVVVVGAGPAGTAAAVELARGDVDVVVLDKATFPRDKCCGDGLTALALRLLDELGLDPAVVASWHDVDRVFLRSPRGREVELPLPAQRGRYAAVTRRTDLDAALVDLAAAAGARMELSRPLVGVEPADDHVSVSTPAGPVKCRYVVAADGMWSPTRKALGMDIEGYRGDWHAFRQYRTADGPRSRNLWVWFEPDLLPGYAWSFPLPNGVVNVGFGVIRGASMSGKEMAELWRGLLERDHIAAVLGDHEAEGPHKAWPIPARLPGMSLVGPRTFFVGDAAAATDPMTGEGIGQALETGLLAARSILEAGATRPADALATYERRARRALQADHHMASGLSSLLRSAATTEAAITLVDSSPWTRRNFARWMFEDYPRAIIATPGRWSRDIFDRDGAYV